MKTITESKLNKYFDVTRRALEKAKGAKKQNRSLAEDFIDMASRYFSDAKHFRDKRDYVTAFAALNYAHGWLDAGARAKLFDVRGESELFTVD